MLNAAMHKMYNGGIHICKCFYINQFRTKVACVSKESCSVPSQSFWFASFGKLKYVKDISKVQKKDIARSLVTLYASSVSQITAMLSMNSQLDKAIVLGNPFNSLELMQMVKVCTGYFSGNKVNSVFSDYSQFLEIIGMCVEYDKGNKFWTERPSIFCGSDPVGDRLLIYIFINE